MVLQRCLSQLTKIPELPGVRLIAIRPHWGEERLLYERQAT